MPAFNLSATFNVLRALTNPAVICPHYTVSTFDQLPSPLCKAFTRADGKAPDIRAVVLDKDNCFAIPHDLAVYPSYSVAYFSMRTFEQLKKEFPGDRLLIVSNSSGTWEDPGNKEADILEKNTGVKVFKHSTKKPGCWPEIFEYLKASEAKVERPDQVAVIGDRLFTDILMANMMGSWGLWIKDGVRPASEKYYGPIEHFLAAKLAARGFVPPMPLNRKL